VGTMQPDDQARSKSGAPTPLEPEAFMWALHVAILEAVLVIEPGHRVESPPALHYARRVTIPGSTERILSEGGWQVRSWFPRSWGEVARCDLDGSGIAAS